MRNFFKKYRTLLIILLLVIIGTTVFLVVRNARAETTSTFETTPLRARQPDRHHRCHGDGPRAAERSSDLAGSGNGG